MAATDLYEKDYYAWANENAQAIRSGAFGQIDTEALADEVADMAREEKRSVRSRLEILINNLLKWDYQDRKRTRSWAATIDVQRSKVIELLEDSPSLAPFLSENLAAMYRTAVKLCIRDTNLSEDSFPHACPYTLDEILTGKEVRF
jgi:hypothetical protein